MGSYSPYAINESAPPDWTPGEQLAAAAFVGMSLYLAVENNIAIYRLFTHRQGLYFWGLQVGSWAIVFDAIGIIFKFLAPKPRVWPLYTIALTLGWGTFSTAQLLVLYSRLHLVYQNRRVQQYVYIMAWASVPCIVVPICVVAWPAWNPYDPALSSRWSPKDAITERYSQVAYTTCETIISVLYIWSLLKLLRLKATVRQRRVMWDLIYVNMLCIALDSIAVILVYLNRTGLNHPVQNFSYMLKFRLEFVVLNQLMSVAARGIRRETMAERRYHHSSIDESMFGQVKPSTQHTEKGTISSKQNPATRSTQVSMPPAALTRESRSNTGPEDRRNAAELPTEHSDDEKVDDAFDHIARNSVPGEAGAEGQTKSSLREAPSNDTIQRSESATTGDHAHLLHHRFNGSKLRNLGALRARRHRSKDDDNDDDEEDDIGLHMWENNGNLVLDVPWFKSRVEV